MSNDEFASPENGVATLSMSHHDALLLLLDIDLAADAISACYDSMSPLAKARSIALAKSLHKLRTIICEASVNNSVNNANNSSLT